MSSVSTAEPALVLRLFGPFAASLHGLPLPRLRSRKEQHLFALLSLRAPRPAERLWIAGMLWPDSTEEAALYNLRRSLHDLRHALGAEYALRLHSPTPGTVALNLEGADVDVQTFDAALRTGTSGALEAALALCRQPLLQDCTEDWADTERAARQEALLAACETCAAQSMASGDTTGAARLLRLALVLDPLRESLVRALMQSLTASADTAAAMDTFRRFRRRLRRELDAAPAPETRALLGTLSEALSPIPPAPLRLPRPLTPLVGRRREVAETVAALDTSRLVTLTGTGGVGKTRLSIAAAQDLSEETEVCFIGLAALTDADLLAATGARSLDIAGPCETTEALVGRLRERSLLLIVDNCEHLLEGCASFVSALLEGCARLRVLATSRQPLGIAGEMIRPVSLLPFPPDDTSVSKPETEYEAVQLFVARARAARPSFSPDPRTLPAIVRICRRLDGLPLAIELAASRVRSLSCDQIAQKLDDRFSLLAGGNRGALPRHQTLRAAVDWSYDLLTEAERLLLMRLSVFAGGWTAESADVVCGADELPVLDALSGLVDKSLVQMTEEADGSVRYFLLETLREYGQEKLAQSGEVDALYGRAAAWFLNLAEEAQLEGPEQMSWLERLETEHDNLRASLSWYERSSVSLPGLTGVEGVKKAEGGLRLAGTLQRFWEMRGHFSEGRQWLNRAIEKARERGDDDNLWAARSKALNGAGNMAYKQGDYEAARDLHEESLTLRRRLDDRHGIAASLNNLGIIAHEQGDLTRARELLVESLTLRRHVGDRHGVGFSLNNLGNLTRHQGDDEAADVLYKEGLAVFRELGDQQGIGILVDQIGTLAYHRRDYGAAQALFEESLTLRRRLGDQLGIAVSLNNLGNVVQDRGDHGAALALYRESLTLFRHLGSRWGIANSLESLAALAQGQDQWSRAVHLLGTASSLRASFGSPLPAAEQEKIDRFMASARAVLGEEAFARAWSAGQVMMLEAAVDYALQREASPQEAII